VSFHIFIFAIDTKGVKSLLLYLAGGAYVPTVFVGMYATQGRYNVRVPELKHYYGLNHLHYLTTSILQDGIARPSVDGFDSERFRKQWVATFAELRRELKFRIVGYVL